MNNIFDIEKFNLIEDEENYYFFRSLEPGDLKDLENGIIKENNEYTRLRTDRERWEEDHPGESPRWNSESEVSLEEMYSHIKMHYSLQTNCISLSSNANVARTYGEEFSDKYVMIRVPKKEMGERVFHAGPYMLQELEKIVNKEIEKQNLREDVLEDLKAIDEAKTSDEIKELIKTKYKSKEGIDVSKAGLKKGITYRSPQARISSYQSLNEEQTLEKNKIIGKLTVLERKQAMKPLMARASSNNLLIQTVGSAFSSSEQIYYGDIEGDRITDISKEILDIFGLLQQVEGQDKDIITELKREVIKFVNEKRQIDIPEESLLKKQYNLKDNITIEEMYELTDGKVEYGIANSIVKNMFYLSKGQLEARQLAEILRNITNNNSKYDKVIEYIKKNGFEIEHKISTRQSNKGYRLSESVNLNLRTNEVPLVEAIKNLSTEEQIEILEKGGLSDTRNIITDTFSRVQRDEKISREEYYAGAIIDSYDWSKIGIEEFTIEQRSDLLKKLKEKDCVEIYKKLQDAGIPEKDIPLYLINIASKEQFSNILTSDNYIELIRQNKEALSQELSIPQIETFLGYNNIDGTGIILRDDQKLAIERTDEKLKTKRYATVVSPTGSGKSFIALVELLEHKDEKILYLAPNNLILEQMKDYIIEYIHGKEGTLGKTKDEIIAEVFPNIKFETYPGLLAQRGKEIIKDKYDFIVLDELHRTGAKEWEEKLNELLENQKESTKVLGITATPTRDMDDRNMADEMALKLGYTKEEVQRREHIAMDMDLVDAIKLGLVVNPKIVSCEYTLKTDGSMENLLEKINSIEDEDIRKEKIEQYEKLRRKLDSAQGIPEILKQNIKTGGKYIVFIPVRDNGEIIEDEDGNKIGKKTGREKIQEYEQKLIEYLKDSGLNPKCYSMLGAYSDKKNEDQLKSFENDDSEDAKFMIVMNKANEGLHIKGIDGIVWFRALDENSKILYLQQLGRAIYSEDPNNPTPDEKRPVIIDLANNTLKVNIDKEIKNNTRRSDLELLSIVVDWVKLHNGLPNIDSTNKIEQRYAGTLYRIQNEYMKYTNGFEQFSDLDEEKKEEIDEILNKGAEIDLWDIELPPNIIQKANKLLEVNDFEVTGVMRNFVTINDEVDEYDKRYSIEEKIEYLIKRGNINNIKQIEKDEKGNPIGQWKSDIKQAYKKGKLNEEQQKRLEEAGMIWNGQKTLEEKIEYLIKRGNIGSISQREEDEKGNPIGRWKSQIKTAHKDGKLRKKQKIGLEEAGMIWNEGKTKEEQKTTEEKIEYLISRGNISSISRNTKDEKGNPIGRWKNEIKIAYKAGKLRKKQKIGLEDAGMVWNEQKTLEEKIEYLISRGNIGSIKEHKKDEKGNPIARWKKEIKVEYKKGKLSEEQQRRLEEAVMVWNERDEEKTLEEKIEYLIKRGNINNIKRREKDEKGNPIGQWKGNIKQAYKEEKLSEEQQRRLEDAGMVWNEREGEKTLEEKIEYLISRGNIGSIKTNEKDEQGNPIGQWKRNIKQAYKKGKLSEEQQKRLEEAAMIWNEQKTLEEKIEYLIKRGNIGSIKATEKDEKGNPIGQWKSDIKIEYKKGKLSEEQQRRLEEAGMVWNEQKTLEEKIEYLIKRGNTGNISQNTKDEEGNPIGTWKREIKKANKKGKLSEEQKRGLEKSGMVWDEKGKRTGKEIAEASISSIKDMELADAEDVALQLLVEKSKEGGINIDEQS